MKTRTKSTYQGSNGLWFVSPSECSCQIKMLSVLPHSPLLNEDGFEELSINLWSGWSAWTAIAVKRCCIRDCFPWSVRRVCFGLLPRLMEQFGQCIYPCSKYALMQTPQKVCKHSEIDKASLKYPPQRMQLRWGLTTSACTKHVPLTVLG